MLISNPLVALTCPRCGSAFDADSERLSCDACGATHPIVDGIPRLLEQEFYWGEIEKADARRLADEAKEIGWREAVANRFTESDSAWISILDWQRASWIPLLGLPKESVVLDIGSGYGAITHALAASFDEVHSIEAIPERVEFTGARLRQEGFDNVRLVQGSALQLPYPPQSFDAIIVNGVLEWIGDWDLEGDPRSAQLRFLNRLHALLKPSGQLLVGIENRFGYVSARGAIDHSGLPFTNLLPRPLATAALRLFANRHHRMEAPSKSYRTYTYSHAGYQKLFREAQFERSECYWAEPGYNLPYRLAPLTRESVTDALVEMQTETSSNRTLTLSGRVKRMLARTGLFQQVVPEFVFILHKAGANHTRWASVLPPEIAREPQFWLSTQKFGTKTTLRAFTRTNAGVIIKCSTPAPGSRDLVAAEYAELKGMAARASASRSPLTFEVCRPLASLPMGPQLVTVESRAAGERISTLLYRLPIDKRLPFLREYLPIIAESASMIATLSRFRTSAESAASWIDHAKPMLGRTLARRGDALRDKYNNWSGHGDFTVENVLLHPASGKMTVIDWEYVRDGLPPLYDLFTMLAVLTTVVPAISDRSFDDPQLAQFYAAFFHRNEWSELFAQCVARERERLGIDPALTWDMFVDYLVLRIGYLVERKSVYSLSRIRFMEAMMEDWEPRFQMQR